jgi:hypothetical protein
MEVIGERELDLELSGEMGTRKILVRVGKPVEEADGESWTAPYEIHGPDPGEVIRHVAHGIDALQALGCALFIIPAELSSFLPRGRLTHNGREDLRIGFPTEPGSWDERSEPDDTQGQEPEEP